MKIASTLVALATALTFTSALAASELTTSNGQPVSSTAGAPVAVQAPAAHMDAPVAEKKAPAKKKAAHKAKKAKKAAKPAAAAPAASAPAAAAPESTPAKTY